MRNELSANTQPTELPAVALRACWRVDADGSYRITKRMMNKQGGDIVALRTLEGIGEMTLSNNQRFTLPKGTLLFVSEALIVSYGVKYDAWRFYWFEFEYEDQQSLPLSETLELPIAPDEENALARCFDSLKEEKGRLATLSQALFQYRLADWLAQADGQAEQMSGDDLALLLSLGVREHLSVAELARRACMCERTFRILVRRHTGKSPKEYMLNDALDTALALLRTTSLSVREVAESTGFHNSFYFSRIFKERFGLQPSKIRRL